MGRGQIVEKDGVAIEGGEVGPWYCDVVGELVNDHVIQADQAK